MHHDLFLRMPLRKGHAWCLYDQWSFAAKQGTSQIIVWGGGILWATCFIPVSVRFVSFVPCNLPNSFTFGYGAPYISTGNSLWLAQREPGLGVDAVNEYNQFWFTDYLYCSFDQSSSSMVRKTTGATRRTRRRATVDKFSPPCWKSNSHPVQELSSKPLTNSQMLTLSQGVKQ